GLRQTFETTCECDNADAAVLKVCYGPLQDLTAKRTNADPTSDIISDPRQPMRLEKNSNTYFRPQRLGDGSIGLRQSRYFPSIFATMKIRIAPPKPPPNSKYKSEYPAAARTRDVAKITMMDSIDWTVIKLVRRNASDDVRTQMNANSMPAVTR